MTSPHHRQLPVFFLQTYFGITLHMGTGHKNEINTSEAFLNCFVNFVFTTSHDSGNH
jgi:hypothetical protein